MRLLGGRRKIGIAAVGIIAAVGVLASAAVGAAPPLNKLKGSVTADGSSTVGPYTTAAAELFSRAGAKNVQVTVGISGTGGGFERFCKGETDLSDASRPMKITEAATCKTNSIGCVAGLHRRQRRAHCRREPGQHVGEVPLGRRAQEDLGHRLEGEQLEGRSCRVPRPEDQALRPRHRLGHVRLLHRGDQRQGEGEPVGLRCLRGRQRARPGCLRREGRPRLLRLLLLRGEPEQAERRLDQEPEDG